MYTFILNCIIKEYRVLKNEVNGGEKASSSTSAVVNIYEYFVHSNVGDVNGTNAAGNTIIWPRGYPLDLINDYQMSEVHDVKLDELSQKFEVSVFQSLANGNPDVDSVYRLTRNNYQDVIFDDDMAIMLHPGMITPFNAQATTWVRSGFLYMFLPHTVHGRVSDILRSYVSQPLLWLDQKTIAFTKPYVTVKERNVHELMGDFEAELPLFLKFPSLIEYILKRYEEMKDEETKQEGVQEDKANKLFSFYIDLYEFGFVELHELELLRLWIEFFYSLCENNDSFCALVD